MRNITKFDAEVITEYHPLFKSLRWVASARSKDDDRFILQHVHVERRGMDYHIVATDGKRMHVGTFDPGMFDDDISEIAPGEYEVVACAAKKIVLAANDEAGNYPNWRQLMPEDLPVTREVVTRASISRLGIRSGVLLATDFVMDACGFGNGFGKDESVHVEFASERPGGPFLIQHELGKAIVMPIRMDSDGAESEAEATTEIPGALGGLADEGPRIVDVDDVDGEVDEVDEENAGILGGYRDLDDREVDALLSELEHGTPKLKRQAKLQSMLELHGPHNIRKLASYAEWNEPDKHLLKIINLKIAGFGESQPEGDSDY